MSFMEGVKITRLDELDRLGLDRTRLATRLVQSFYKQLFVDRYFHADPHPGNFLVQKGPAGEPRIVVLDFGAISEVSDPLVDGALQVLQGIMTADGPMALKGFREMGFVAEGANEELLEQTVMTYFRKLLKVKDHSAGALIRADRRELEKLANPEMEREELRELMRSIAYPEGWFYVERASVIAFWLVGQIRSGARHDEHRRALRASARRHATDEGDGGVTRPRIKPAPAPARSSPAPSVAPTCTRA